MVWQLILYGFATVLAIRTLTTLMAAHKNQYMEKLVNDYENQMVEQAAEQKLIEKTEKLSQKETAQTAA